MEIMEFASHWPKFLLSTLVPSNRTLAGTAKNQYGQKMLPEALSNLYMAQ